MKANLLLTNQSLVNYTSFKVGGRADTLIETGSSEGLLNALAYSKDNKAWVLGYGSNTLISDKGLPGVTIVLRGGEIAVDGDEITVDAGVWWDDVVKLSVENHLWGIEMLSEIPGSVGAALLINIAAYGQMVGTSVAWVEIWKPGLQKIIRLEASDLHWSYKKSIFQDKDFEGAVITRACFALSKSPVENLEYQKALDAAAELKLDVGNLAQRREAIIEARNRAGSLWRPDDLPEHQSRTAGSFFRNPLINADQVEAIITHDESGKTADQIKKMNSLHGGDTSRVSAAHVMLAAGFKRGQVFNNVKLNDKNLLKIEALPGATAQDIYNAMRLIQTACQEKLGITLEPEVQLLGEFSD